MRSALINNLILLLCCVSLCASCAPTGVYHTVKPGQTLYRIARTYEIDEGQLARINHIKDPTQLKVDQKLYIPGVSHLRKVPATVTPTQNPSPRAATSPPEKQNQSEKDSRKPQAKTPTVKTPAVKTPAAESPAAVADKPVKGIFVWPAKGKVLSGFGAQDQKVNKGIEIAVSKGSAVVAAASGKVIYSGNAIAGYGNLVILEHSDNYFSVYGYNQKNLVKMDDHVGQGEKIALSGLPPNGESARLHFEIRKGKSAVNPILYLP